MPDIPDQAVFGRVENVMQRNRQFDDPQTGAQMTARIRHDVNDFLTDLLRQIGQILQRQGAQVGRRFNRVQQREVNLFLRLFRRRFRRFFSVHERRSTI